jgi:hypothetical protein
VRGHHLNQRLSENHAGPFIFGATLGLHWGYTGASFSGKFVSNGVGVNPFSKVRREASHLLSASHY